MKWVAWFLWIASVASGIAAVLLEGSTIPWFVASVVSLGLVRIEALHEKLDKFVVVDDD